MYQTIKIFAPQRLIYLTVTNVVIMFAKDEIGTKVKDSK